MVAPVVFDPVAFAAQFPEFAAVPAAALQGNFNLATIYCRNDGGGPIETQSVLQTLLYLLTAHVTALGWQAQGDANPGQPKDPSTPVGRISDAAEGSVHVSTQNDYPPGSAQWFQQTRYGAMYWQASAQYRQMRYAPGCFANRFGPGGPGTFPFRTW